MTPVDTALRADGGLAIAFACEASDRLFIACAVFCCNALIAVVGEALLVALFLGVKEESKRSVCTLDNDGARLLVFTFGGGGGIEDPRPTAGLGCEKNWEVGIGDRLQLLGANSGEIVVAALTGVL